MLTRPSPISARSNAASRLAGGSDFDTIDPGRGYPALNRSFQAIGTPPRALSGKPGPQPSARDAATCLRARRRHFDEYGLVGIADDHGDGLLNKIARVQPPGPELGSK